MPPGETGGAPTGGAVPFAPGTERGGRPAPVAAGDLGSGGMDDEAAILAIGDVHLGTRCSGVPDSVASWGIDPGRLTPAAALETATAFAIERNVAAVLFAGDVVESANARFEALPPFEEAVRRLREAGIEVIAVAGNHDVEALPRLADLLGGFTLLGAGGNWESRVVERTGIPVAEIVGWSFDERIVRRSPVAELLREPLEPASPSVPRIGLLHADLDASGGNHAPVRRRELDDAGHDAWLLGHIHKPSLGELSAGAGSGPSGYLGSLAALDPSETGPHGPWLATLGRGVRLAHVPLAPLRWERIDVPVEGIGDADGVEERLLGEAAELARRIGRDGRPPLALGLTARLTGPSSCHEEIRSRVAAGEWDSLGRVVDETVVFYRKIVPAVSPRLELAGIARGDDPAALLARRLMVLERDDDRSRELLDEVRAALEPVAGDERWSVVDERRGATDPLSDEALRDVLLRSGMTALHAMLSGNGPDNPS